MQFIVVTSVQTGTWGLIASARGIRESVSSMSDAKRQKTKIGKMPVSWTPLIVLVIGGNYGKYT